MLRITDGPVDCLLFVTPGRKKLPDVGRETVKVWIQMYPIKLFLSSLGLEGNELLPLLTPGLLWLC